MSKLKKVISKVMKPKIDPSTVNPWLSIEHDCDWLPANDGKELVCGMCSTRKPA